MAARKPKLTPWVLTSKRPPPGPGWWNASKSRDTGARRWWNGEVWSSAVFVGQNDRAATFARNNLLPARANHQIEWRGLSEPPEDTPS